MGMLATIAVYATLSIKSYLYILGKVILETFSFTVTRLLPKENFREPFGLPKSKLRSPTHIPRSPELVNYLFTPHHKRKR